jgi:hypothetical protein
MSLIKGKIKWDKEDGLRAGLAILEGLYYPRDRASVTASAGKPGD